MSHVERKCCNLGPIQSRVSPSILQYTKMRGFGAKVRALGLRLPTGRCFGLEVSGFCFGLRVWDFGFLVRVSGLGFRVGLRVADATH